jgi:DNA-binding NarL/FixJ family response regulator
MSDLASRSSLPRVIVVEDGLEYTERFSRLLSAQFIFERVADFSTLVSALETAASVVLLDLDFRRTPVDQLIDGEGGAASPNGAAELAAVQGILILRSLRKRGERLPALLCADLDDPEQARLLCEELGPLQISPSSESLPELANRLRELAGLSAASTSI